MAHPAHVLGLLMRLASKSGTLAQILPSSNLALPSQSFTAVTTAFDLLAMKNMAGRGQSIPQGESRTVRRSPSPAAIATNLATSSDRSRHSFKPTGFFLVGR